jgi:hypothetical protein
VANYFLWRAKDWERNSLTMYASGFFSHKQLHSKTKQDRHDMLHSIGKNWATDVDERSKNGTFFSADWRTVTFRQRTRISPPWSTRSSTPTSRSRKRRVTRSRVRRWR